MHKANRIRLLLLGTVVLALGACNSAGPATEEADASAPVIQVQPVVSATGEVVPADWTELSFQQAGRIVSIEVEEGDVVSAGDLLASLDLADLQAGVDLAEAALASAQANLEKVKAGPRPEEIEAAENALAAANARTAAAAARKNQLFEVTEGEVAAAREDVETARFTLDNLYLDMGAVITWADSTDLRTIDPHDRNPLQAGEGLAYQIELAELNLAAAEAALNELTNGPNPDVLRLNNARIAASYASASAAKARLDYLKAQPFPENIAVAEAQVTQAEADVVAADARLNQGRIVAPFDGTVTAIFTDAAEFIAPGQRIIQIGILDTLRVETTDLNEIDVARVAVGNSATVTFDALPGEEVPGTVISISPKAEEGTGVNYTVVIELENVPPAVRWGMTAFVDIDVTN